MNITKFFKRKMSRREFLKKSLLATLALGVGYYFVNQFISKRTKTIFSSTFKNEAPEKLWKWSKEAYYYTQLGKNVQCQVCPNRCLLEPNERSVCRVKVNIEGTLYTLVYGNPCAVHIDPIEKKPLFHFLPGTKAFSIATAGCNFRCLNCQNWEISQSRPEETINYDLMPEKVIEKTKETGCQSIAYTYSEPVAFYDYMLDTSKLASKEGIKNLWITNGYINEEPLRELCKYMDAANVDLKSFKEEIYNQLNAGSLKPVLNTLKILKEEGVWLEVTNLIVPTWTDDLDMIREMCKWLVRNIGKDYPLHFSRFFPHYKLTHLPPTPIETLERAREIAMEEGLKFVYIGNVPLHPAENTYCPKCEKLLIERKGFLITQNNVENGSCKFCGEKIAGVWEL